MIETDEDFVTELLETDGRRGGARERLRRGPELPRLLRDLARQLESACKKIQAFTAELR